MKIGRSVYATINGTTYSGKVTSMDENGLVFTTPDGATYSAAKGEAHRVSSVHHLFGEGAPFTKAPKGSFHSGDLIVSKSVRLIPATSTEPSPLQEPLSLIPRTFTSSEVSLTSTHLRISMTKMKRSRRVTLTRMRAITTMKRATKSS
jgi:hypothetical protein